MACRCVPAQAAQPAPASLEEALRSVFLRADVIFAGEVTSIIRSGDIVTVSFRVDDAVSGVASREYAVREWAGLWRSDGARYRVGGRYLMLLYAPSAAGLMSTVSGDGAVPLDGSGAAMVADLRWLAAQVAVTDAARLAPLRTLRATRAAAPECLAGNFTGNLAGYLADPAPVPVPATSPASAQRTAQPAPIGDARVDGSLVLDILHAWQRDRLAR